VQAYGPGAERNFPGAFMFMPVSLGEEQRMLPAEKERRARQRGHRRFGPAHAYFLLRWDAADVAVAADAAADVAATAAVDAVTAVIGSLRVSRQSTVSPAVSQHPPSLTYHAHRAARCRDVCNACQV
jgi:hypothetical protein